MTIYIESFILQNLIINFCLLRLVKITVKPKTSFFRLMCASIVGALFSVVGAMFLTNNIMLNSLKFVCAVLMVLLAFKQTKRQFVFNFILLFIYTFALSGAITNLAGNCYATSFGVIISSKISLEMVLGFVIVLTYLFELVAKHLKFKIKTNNLIYPITLHFNNNKISINAFLDTGNFLKYNNQPVVIVDLAAYLKLTKKSYMNFVLSKAETVNLGTVTGKNSLKLFKIDLLDVKVDGKIKSFKNQYIAVNTMANFKNTNYQALITTGLI